MVAKAREAVTKVAGITKGKVAATVTRAVIALSMAGLLGWFVIWPFNVLAVTACLMTAAVFTYAGYMAMRASKRKINPGEEAVYAFLDSRTQDFWNMLPLWLLGAVVIGFGFGTYFYFGWPANAVSLLGSCLVGGVMMYFSGSPLKRVMADLGWWCVKVPENTAMPVETDEGCYIIIINTRDPKLLAHYRLLAKKYEQESADGRSLYVFTKPGNSIYFLGWTKWPWRFRLKKPFYLHQGDADKSTVQPYRGLSLKEQTWDWLRETDPGGVVKATGTNDPIDIIADLFVRAIVWDPYKVLYGSEYTGEAVQKVVLARWREVVAMLYYFAKASFDVIVGGDPKEGSDARGKTARNSLAELEINPRIQIAAAILLNWKLKTVYPRGKEYSYPAYLDQQLAFNLAKFDHEKQSMKMRPVVPELREVAGRGVVVWEPFLKDSPAWICMESFGWQILSVQVQDLEPKSSAIADAVEKAKAATATAAQAAKEAQGDAVRIREIADAEAHAVNVVATEVSRPGGREAIAARVSEKVAPKVQGLTIIAGGGSDVEKMASLPSVLAAAGGVPIRQIGVAPAASEQNEGDSQPPAQDQPKGKGEPPQRREGGGGGRQRGDRGSGGRGRGDQGKKRT